MRPPCDWTAENTKPLAGGNRSSVCTAPARSVLSTCQWAGRRLSLQPTAAQCLLAAPSVRHPARPHVIPRCPYEIFFIICIFMGGN